MSGTELDSRTGFLPLRLVLQLHRAHTVLVVIAERSTGKIFINLKRYFVGRLIKKICSSQSMMLHFISNSVFGMWILNSVKFQAFILLVLLTFVDSLICYYLKVIS